MTAYAPQGPTAVARAAPGALRCRNLDVWHRAVTIAPANAATRKDSERPDKYRTVASAALIKAVALASRTWMDGPTRPDPGAIPYRFLGDQSLHEHLATVLGVTPRTVQHALNALVDVGFLVQVTRGHTGSRATYAAALPSAVAHAEVEAGRLDRSHLQDVEITRPESLSPDAPSGVESLSRDAPSGVESLSRDAPSGVESLSRDSPSSREGASGQPKRVSPDAPQPPQPPQDNPSRAKAQATVGRPDTTDAGEGVQGDAQVFDLARTIGLQLRVVTPRLRTLMRRRIDAGWTVRDLAHAEQVGRSLPAEVASPAKLLVARLDQLEHIEPPAVTRDRQREATDTTVAKSSPLEAPGRPPGPVVDLDEHRRAAR